jgi:hypothetical protein
MIIGIMMGRLTLRTLSDLPVMRKVRLLSLALLISILVPVLFMMESSLFKQQQNHRVHRELGKQDQPWI